MSFWTPFFLWCIPFWAAQALTEEMFGVATTTRQNEEGTGNNP